MDKLLEEFIKDWRSKNNSKDAIYSSYHYDAMIEFAKHYHSQQLILSGVSSCYALFNEEDNIVLIYQTEEKANKRMEEFKRSHEHTDFYVDTIKIH